MVANNRSSDAIIPMHRWSLSVNIFTFSFHTTLGELVLGAPLKWLKRTLSRTRLYDSQVKTPTLARVFIWQKVSFIRITVQLGVKLREGYLGKGKTAVFVSYSYIIFVVIFNYFWLSEICQTKEKICECSPYIPWLLLLDRKRVSHYRSPLCPSPSHLLTTFSWTDEEQLARMRCWWDELGGRGWAAWGSSMGRVGQ